MERYDDALVEQMRELRQKYSRQFEIATGYPLSLFWNPMSGLDLQALKSWLVVNPLASDEELWALIERKYDAQFAIFLTAAARDSAWIMREYWNKRTYLAQMANAGYNDGSPVEWLWPDM